MEQNIQANAYSEVYGVLKILGPKYINRIPKKLYSLIEENREKSYNPIFDLTIPLSKQNISKEGTSFICLLHYNYWCTSEEEKSKINKILKYNTEQARNKYFEYEKKLNKLEINIDKPVKKEFNISQNNTAIAVRKNDSIFKRIWKFFKHIFG